MWEFLTGIFQALFRADWAYRRALRTLEWARQMLLAAGLALCYLAMNIQLQLGPSQGSPKEPADFRWAWS